MPGDKALIDFIVNNEQDIRKWLKVRPTAQGSYDDLLREAQVGEVSVKRTPTKKWDSYVRKTYNDKKSGRHVGGFYDSSSKTINLKEGGEGSLPHEAMHYFSSHRPGEYGAPKQVNPYIKADIAAGGWLPSFHPGGRRPHIGGKLGETSMGNWWNVNKATKDVEYSNTKGYHPWMDEHSFDLAKTFGKKSNASIDIKKKLGSMKQKIGQLFKKEKGFGDTFKGARAEGLDEFEWKGNKYHTKYKEEMGQDSFEDKWNKSWKLRGSNY